FVDGADVGMVERGRRARFAPEALQRLMVSGYIVRKEFQCDKTAQLAVFSLVDHAHTTATKLFQDAIVRDGLTDHEGRYPSVKRMLGGIRKQVKPTCHRGARRGGCSRPAERSSAVSRLCLPPAKNLASFAR